jgi:hypothetical protein
VRWERTFHRDGCLKFSVYAAKRDEHEKYERT